MLSELSESLAGSLGLPYWICFVVVKVLVAAAVFLPAISLLAMLSIWAERKVAGHIQGRLGPKHVGPFGILQSLADGIKLLVKEDLVPAGADSFLFRLAPYLAFAPVLAAFLAIPFGPQFVFEAGLNVGLLYILAILGVEVMGVILSGWASNSKWAIYGAMREACQMVSYEIPLGVAILCGVLVAGTLNLVELGYLQGGGIQSWFFYQNPFIFGAFFIYFIASLAASKRAPYDLPEGESELVAGFHTEYSGLRFSFFFFAEYAGMFVVGCIQAVLFLGAWNSPLGAYDPVYAALGYDPVSVGQAFLTGSYVGITNWTELAGAMHMNGGALGIFVLNVYGMTWVIGKALLVVFIHMWLRWTLPRIRIDQVMHGCVKGLLPLSLAMLVGTAVWLALVQPAAEVQARYAVTTANVAHLTGEVGSLQTLTQWILTALGVALFGFYAMVILGAIVSRRAAPRKGMFEDVMPVGSEVAFTRGPDYQSQEERSLKQS
ncbi:MAG: NADH-quinone oxidoreductase subunit H [Phycisphaerales bacterium]|nr:NADH-quinone oxidoreductase subunit H [Phycisphaerales bacterium]